MRDRASFRAGHAAEHLLGKVSFMPQRDLLLPWRSVLDNAILALEIEACRGRKPAPRALPMFADSASPVSSGTIRTSFGGMRQRVALMRTFLFEREIMLLDEPFGALDALTRALMQRWLLDVWQRHRRTVLFITHDIEEAIFLGDRVLVMTARPGHIKLELPIDLGRPRDPRAVASAEFLAPDRRCWRRSRRKV